MPESRTRAAVDGNRQPGRRWRALLVSLAVVLVVASVPSAAWATPVLVLPTQDESADETGAGEVIADGRARLPRGEIVWTIRQVDVPGGEGIAVEEFPLGFALVEEGTVALRAEDDESPTELATGEAAFLPNRKAGTLVSVEADAASLVEIAIVSRRDAESAAEAEAGEESGVVVGEPFPTPAGTAESAATPTPEGEEQAATSFEMKLVRNTLSGQDEATIPVSGSGAPVLYLTIDGTAQLQAGEQVVDLDTGQFALLAGEVQVRAATDAAATFVVASIGEEAEARERGERAERQPREERQREPRARAGEGGGRQGNASAGGQGQSDRAARRAARQAARQAQGGSGGQSQQQGTGDTGGAPVTGGADATATVPVPAGTPGVEPTPEPTLPTDPTVPADGTPPPVETPPVDETAVPTATVSAGETPAPEPTVPVVPINPPVPEVPGVPGVPTEETVAAESVPAAEEPAPEATLPVEEAPAPVEETQPTEPAPEE